MEAVSRKEKIKLSGRYERYLEEEAHIEVASKRTRIGGIEGQSPLFSAFTASSITDLRG